MVLVSEEGMAKLVIEVRKMKKEIAFRRRDEKHVQLRVDREIARREGRHCRRYNGKRNLLTNAKEESIRVMVVCIVVRVLQHSDGAGLNVTEVGNRAPELSQARVLHGCAGVGRRLLQRAELIDQPFQPVLARSSQSVVVAGKAARNPTLEKSGPLDELRQRCLKILNEHTSFESARAYDHDRALGLMVEVAAVTGARLSQLARLEVADLQADGPEPRLLMPLSAKGRARNKRHERRPVPITGALASVRKQEAADRASGVPLLTRADGSGWGHSRTRHHRDDFRAVVQAAELDPDEVTLYALRHSSIVRQLLANVPIRIVATLHDTSVRMIERTYSRYIAGHSDAIARRALLEIQQPSAANVVPLSKGR
jgi:integrase